MKSHWMSAIATVASAAVLVGMAECSRPTAPSGRALGLARETSESTPGAGRHTTAAWSGIPTGPERSSRPADKVGSPGVPCPNENSGTRPWLAATGPAEREADGASGAGCWPTLLLRLLAVPLVPLLGWGVVTHAWINRLACKKAKGALPEVLGTQEAQRKFETYGALPDALSLFALTENDHAFDSFHNLVPYGNNGEPVFAQQLLGAGADGGDMEARIAAYGWCAHQLADSVAHYWGYCESLPTFGSLFPGTTQRDKVGRRVLRDMDHGITEILCDVVAVDSGGTDLVRWSDLRCAARFIEEASRRAGGFPVLSRQEWEQLFTKFWAALPLIVVGARALRHTRFPGTTAPQMIGSHYDGPNGSVNGGGLGKWRQEAVDLVADFLQDPESHPWRERSLRPPPPAAEGGGLPSGQALGLPQRGGALLYRLVMELLKRPRLTATLAKQIPRLPDAWEPRCVLGPLRKACDSEQNRRHLTFRVAGAVVDGFAQGLAWQPILDNVMRALPPLVDTDKSYPQAGEEIPDPPGVNEVSITGGA